MKVKTRIKELLAERGWTQKELEEHTQISQAVLSRMDKNTRYEGWHLVKLARAFDIPMDQLFIVMEEEEE